MANDRILITCRGCGERRTFAKYYPSLGHGIWYVKDLDDWVCRHMECSPHFGDMNLGGDRCFDLDTESKGRKSLRRNQRVGLVKARMIQNFTQRQLARQSGVSQGVISKIENGAVATEKVQRRLADALRMSIRDIFNAKDAE